MELTVKSRKSARMISRDKFHAAICDKLQTVDRCQYCNAHFWAADKRQIVAADHSLEKASL